MPARLIGRSEELAAINSLLEQARRSPAPVALTIAGDAGSGKSRLLTEAMAAGAGELISTISGYEPERDVPLAAARDLLREMAWAPHEGLRLKALLFDAPSAAGVDPMRVFEGVHRCAAEKQISALFVDDLQWVDDQTIALCHYLTRAARNGFALVIAARPCPALSRLSESLRSLVVGGAVRELWLAPLSQAHGIELAVELDPELDEEEARRLWSRAGGNPFWLEALVETVDDEARLGDLLELRLSMEPDDALQLLGVLALVGRPLSAGECASLLGWSDDRTATAAEHLLDRGLAIRRGLALMASQDLVREAALRLMTAAQADDLRRRLVERLERDSGDDVQLLWQALTIRQAVGLPLVELALKIVGSPHRRLLSPQSVAELGRIADESARMNHAHATELSWGLAELCGEVGEEEAAVGRWRSLAQVIGDPGRRARALYNAARIEFRRQRLEEAVGLHESAVREAAGDPILELELAALEAHLLRDSSGADRAPLERAVRGARELIDRFQGVDGLDRAARAACLAALEARFDSALRHSRPNEMVEVAGEMLAVSRGSGEPYINALLEKVLGLRILGRYLEAEEAARHAWSEARRQILPGSALHAGFQLARTLHALGRLEEAAAAANETASLADRVGTPFWFGAPQVRGLE
ncbi:MAG: AAA family ATPase, partial [Actinomycetota bacterium]